MRIRHTRSSAALAALGLMTALAGCERPIAATPAATAGPGVGAPGATKVEVVRPTRQTIRRTTEQPGQVEAFESTPIHAKLSGYARDIAVDIGDEVKQGQVLAALRVPEVEADLEQKKASIDQAEAMRAQAEASVQVAEADVAGAGARLAVVRATIQRAEADLTRWRSESGRIDRLVRESSVTASLGDETRSRLRGAEAARDEARAELKSAEAAVVQSEAGLEKARADVVAAASGVEVAESEARRAEALLGYARIEAPFDGVITRRGVDTGHLTVPGPQGEPLFVVARTDIVTIAIDVPETYAGAVSRGDKVLVRIQALGGLTVEGEVTRTSYALDTATRTLRAEVDLPNADGALRPGLYAYATVIAEDHPDALTLPATAVVRDGEQAVVVVVAGGRAARRAVELGLNDGTNVEVISGLDGDESVVKANAASLTDGQPVEPTEPAGPAGSPAAKAKS